MGWWESSRIPLWMIEPPKTYQNKKRWFRSGSWWRREEKLLPLYQRGGQRTWIIYWFADETSSSGFTAWFTLPLFGSFDHTPDDDHSPNYLIEAVPRLTQSSLQILCLKTLRLSDMMNPGWGGGGGDGYPSVTWEKRRLAYWMDDGTSCFRPTDRHILMQRIIRPKNLRLKGLQEIEEAWRMRRRMESVEACNYRCGN